MSDRTWKGTASTTAQVAQKNVASSTSGHTFIITLYYEDGTAVAVLTHAVDGVDAGNATLVAAEIVAEFNLLTHELATPITASNSTSKLILTADVAGIPFYVGYSGTGTWNDSGCTLTGNSGPNDWNVANNWTGNTVPVDTDNVYIDATSSDAILYGLFQDAALTANSSITFALVKVEKGAPQIGTLLEGPTHKITTLDIGQEPGNGQNVTSSHLWHFKPGNVAVAVTVHSTNSQGTSGKAPLLLDIDNSSATVLVKGNSIVGLATAIQGETSSIATLTVQGNAKVTCGSGLTLVTLNPEGGTTTLNAGLTTINNGLGTVIVRGAGNITTVNNSGQFEWDSSGTITTYNGHGKSVGKFWKGTTTSGNLYGPDAYYDAAVSGIAGNHVVTNGVDCLALCPTKNVNFGDSRNVQQAAP